jgi:DNA polymerase elongation subunit (family B)
MCGASYEENQRNLKGEKPENLLKIEVPKYSELSRLARRINEEGRFSRFQLYNADINYSLRYLFGKKISPMLLLAIDGTGDGLRYEELEDPGETDYEVPPLKIAGIRKKRGKKKGFTRLSDPLWGVELSAAGEKQSFEDDEATLLTDLAQSVQQLDPDVIYIDGGSHELSYLYHRAEENDVINEFQLGRENSRPKKKDGKTYFTYGRVVYKPPSYSLKGRLLIDRGAFLYSESGIHGLVDLSRFSGIPVQQLSRMSPGNAITTMQLRHAYENSILIPWKRQNPEYFKTAWKLLHSDRGGYIFDPKVGIYDDGVAELDFASMYPNIMVRFNVSPETVLCPCCPKSRHKVPVLHYHVCEKRTGLVPQVLKPVIERRFAYKKLVKNSGKELADLYDERQAILKWLLITSFGYQGYRNARFGRIEGHFGYQGYRNARFGRIEGHETICAYGRELLLRAKEVAEHFDFEVLHGLVDSLWVRREASVKELEELCEFISAEIGIDINLEGRYRWIVFLPNRSTGVGALNRYYGVFEDGSVKARGVETRMRNTPGLISSFQREALEILATAQNAKEFYGLLGKIFVLLKTYAQDLREGRVDPGELVFKIGISRRLAEYRVNNFSYAALKQLEQIGVELLPGQSIRYIVTNQRSRRYSERVKIAESHEEGDGYDAEFYVEHIVRAAESLLLPFGYTTERLKGILQGERQSSLAAFY